jgi:hypothetical protein
MFSEFEQQRIHAQGVKLKRGMRRGMCTHVLKGSVEVRVALGSCKYHTGSGIRKK